MKGTEGVVRNVTRNLHVGDMSCGGCETAVVDALRDVDGVERAEADHETGRVTIEGGADDADVRAAVEEAGYTFEESA